MTDMVQREELASFLRSRREGTDPVSVGLRPGPRRRTPGLRREELAQLSGISVTWYTWLEQGRHIGVSREVIERYPGDPRGPELVAALTAASPKFAELWQQHPTARFRGYRKSYRHPTAGPLSLDIIALTASSNEQQHLTVLLPADQATADKLGQLR